MTTGLHELADRELRADGWAGVDDWLRRRYLDNVTHDRMAEELRDRIGWPSLSRETIRRWLEPMREELDRERAAL